jgi:t-SNARE complex subunit (syntaxin)
VLDDLPVSTSVDRTTSGDQMVVMEVKEKEKDKSMVTKEYYERRAQEAKGLLISFETVAQAFRELQQHILHQGGLVDVVGYNVEQSAMNIEKAEEQLIITVKEQSSNRGLYAKIFAVLLFFILVFFALL